MSTLAKLENCRKAGYQINDGAYTRGSANRRIYAKATVLEQWQNPQKMLEHQNDKLRRYEEDNLKEIYNFLSTGGFARKY